MFLFSNSGWSVGSGYTVGGGRLSSKTHTHTHTKPQACRNERQSSPQKERIENAWSHRLKAPPQIQVGVVVFKLASDSLSWLFAVDRLVCLGDRHAEEGNGEKERARGRPQVGSTPWVSSYIMRFSFFYMSPSFISIWFSAVLFPATTSRGHSSKAFNVVAWQLFTSIIKR